MYLYFNNNKTCVILRATKEKQTKHNCMFRMNMNNFKK